MNRQTIKITLISEVMSPLTHMSGIEGNEAIVNRQMILTGGKIVSVPVLSGNALRHKTIREPGAKYLIAQYDMLGKMNIDQVNFMLHGGTLTESSASENMSIISEMQRLFPLYRMLGGSLRNQIISGSIICQRGILFCRETSAMLNRILPEEMKIDKDLRSCEDFIGGYKYTRGDARKDSQKIDFFAAVDELNKDEKSNLMIFGGQSILPGSVFAHGYVCKNISTVEIGCLFTGLQIWQSEGGVIGGKQSIGHGQMQTWYHVDKEIDVQACISEYMVYIATIRNEATAWLTDQFKKREGKKGAKIVQESDDQMPLA